MPLHIWKENVKTAKGNGLTITQQRKLEKGRGKEFPTSPHHLFGSLFRSILHYNNNVNHGNFTHEKLEKERLDIVISSSENKTRDRIILSWRKLLYCDKGTNSLRRQDHFKGKPDRHEIGAVVTNRYGRAQYPCSPAMTDRWGRQGNKDMQAGEKTHFKCQRDQP